MTPDEAKLLLQVCRPGGQDAADPRFAEALELAKHDPELAGWWAQERAFDSVISQDLQSTPVPAQLRMAILAGEKVLAQLAWWQLVNWRRVAVCALVLLVGAGFFFFSLNRTESLLVASREALELAKYRSVHLTLQTNDLATVRRFLTKCRAPADFVVPAGLRKLPLMGCTLVGVRVQTAAVVCFRIVGDHHFTLVVLDAIADDAIPADGRVRIIEDGDWATALWSEKGKTYILSGKVHPDSLRRILI